jgi:hypothetical protein
MSASLFVYHAKTCLSVGVLETCSNHLDIDATNALIEGLATFKGGVLMVGTGGLIGIRTQACSLQQIRVGFSRTIDAFCSSPKRALLH